MVEVVRYRGPVNATIIRRHQQWLDAAQTRSARHKIAKFLKHAVRAASMGLAAPGACSAARAPLRAAAVQHGERMLPPAAVLCDCA